MEEKWYARKIIPKESWSAYITIKVHLSAKNIISDKKHYFIMIEESIH